MDEGINPYAPPAVRGPKACRESYTAYSTAQLLQFIRDDRALRTMGGFFLIASLLPIAVRFVLLREIQLQPLHWAAGSLWSGWLIISYIGVMTRHGYGRWMGRYSCIMLMLIVPIGTFIGWLGRMLFRRSKMLFNPGKLSVPRLKRELKHRRKHGIE